MNIQTIAEHSVDLDLLSGGICIDVGCRGFLFSEAMRDKGLSVWAFDLEDMVAPEGIEFVKKAITDTEGNAYYVDTPDQQAKYISSTGIPVEATTLHKVYQSLFAVNPNSVIDLVKCDAEGSEYFIFSDATLPPLPKQLSIEFHEHCFPGLHGAAFESCMRNITRHYVPVQHERYRAHGAGWNYWNSLFIRKDLINNHE
jgi:hypothetical protein